MKHSTFSAPPRIYSLQATRARENCVFDIWSRKSISLFNDLLVRTLLRIIIIIIIINSAVFIADHHSSFFDSGGCDSVDWRRVRSAN